MGHDRGDNTNVIPSSEDEEGYSDIDTVTSSLNPYTKVLQNCFGETVKLREFVFDDTDQQFWAEDELSSTDSRSIVSKHQRRHSVAHRNRTYRSRSRLNHTSSSSSYVTNVKNPQVRRRKKLRIQDKYSITTRPPNSSTRRSIVRINCETKFRLHRSKKK